MKPIAALNLAAVQSGYFNTGVANPCEGIEVVNESPSTIVFSDRFANSWRVPAQHKRIIELRQAVQELDWAVELTLAVQNAPANVVLLGSLTQQEVTDAKDTGTMDIPLSSRTANIGNTVATSGSASVKNDGNPPGDTVIEATPSDQTTSAIIDNNDGTSARYILSEGQQRQVWGFVRGDFGTTKAILELGDVNDPSILTLHGSADSAAVAGLANSAGVANTARAVTVYDGDITVQRDITQYEGATDPTTYVVPSFGDIWWEG